MKKVFLIITIALFSLNAFAQKTINTNDLIGYWKANEKSTQLFFWKDIISPRRCQCQRFRRFRRPGRLDRSRGGHDLIFTFDRAGAGHNADLARADPQVANLDLSRFGFDFQAGDLVRGQNRHDLGDPGAALERLFGVLPLFANRGDHRTRG